ncbi:Meiosis-specific serine/threonine-protein kinase mek1 [Sparassis crispa]|uniref:Meiosis-specific serine/threonine-protein kinase mek1 n=1 Tax=Sparassis crispa TaxID=139825 RepID=A0A401G6L5_9APHY|nr:Meiosis-specific serine/threonine-protein kinase mek1 [Sparassis crispa]GBE77811.1 Meiosis-specific serine/threonine-protein kinase mek1 [Sparassis crispa]
MPAIIAKSFESCSESDSTTASGSGSRTPPAPIHPDWSRSTGACAKLVTVNKDGNREALLLHVDRSLTIGRHPSCSYVVPDLVVSSLHCKLYAVKSSDGGIILSCQDFSTNGLILNSHKIRKTSVILMDGDVVEIPHSQKFECILLEKPPSQNTNIFDPTPPRERSPKTKRIDRYLVASHCLGSGSFATVHLAMDTTEHRQVACKSIKRKNNDKIEKVMKEVDILLRLTHPNINRVWAANYNSSFVHIFLELCTGGDLFSYIVGHTDSRLCEGEAKYIMYQLMKGLKYLHDRQISHRDLKVRLFFELL